MSDTLESLRAEWESRAETWGDACRLIERLFAALETAERRASIDEEQCDTMTATATKLVEQLEAVELEHSTCAAARTLHSDRIQSTFAELDKQIEVLTAQVARLREAGPWAMSPTVEQLAALLTEAVSRIGTWQERAAWLLPRLIAPPAEEPDKEDWFDFETFRREMAENVVPRIVEKVKRRRLAAERYRLNWLNECEHRNARQKRAEEAEAALAARPTQDGLVTCNICGRGGLVPGGIHICARPAQEEP